MSIMLEGSPLCRKDLVVILDCILKSSTRNLLYGLFLYYVYSYTLTCNFCSGATVTFRLRKQVDCTVASSAHPVDQCDFSDEISPFVFVLS